MKVTAFIGSGRKQHSYNASEKLLQNLQLLGNIEYEIVRLGDYNLGTCKGCRICFDKGEEFCPFKDDRDTLIEKMVNSDGVIFSSPNYSFQVSSLMKIFIDRLAYKFHRPSFFGKTFTSIVVQGIGKGEDIVKYLDFIGKGMGFNIVKGCVIKTLEPMTEKSQNDSDRIVEKQSKKFYKQLIKKDFPTPSLWWIMVFRMARTSMYKMLNENWRDYTYYRDKGWFESDYFYPVKLNLFKRLSGRLFDKLAIRIIRS
ncbi:MAG: NADPH-dependent FMN reductase [Bacteroidetes bacterium GWF2_33_16]|nr:MAG: NADPH-dependent FMN reductase [Bacteroidetes bacterium GWE2_32_14]OFY08227.1 MAG: NADPH-dependent FMN reductase [Bacteroidetes bacterium GWF2_33_16]